MVCYALTREKLRYLHTLTNKERRKKRTVPNKCSCRNREFRPLWSNCSFYRFPAYASANRRSRSRRIPYLARIMLSCIAPTTLTEQILHHSRKVVVLAVTTLRYLLEHWRPAYPELSACRGNPCLPARCLLLCEPCVFEGTG